MGELVGAGVISKRMLLAKVLYIAIVLLILFPFDKLGIPAVTAPIALFVGLLFAFLLPMPYPK